MGIRQARCDSCAGRLHGHTSAQITADRGVPLKRRFARPVPGVSVYAVERLGHRVSTSASYSYESREENSVGRLVANTVDEVTGDVRLFVGLGNRIGTLRRPLPGTQDRAARFAAPARPTAFAVTTFNVGVVCQLEKKLRRITFGYECGHANSPWIWIPSRIIEREPCWNGEAGQQLLEGTIAPHRTAVKGPSKNDPETGPHRSSFVR